MNLLIEQRPSTLTSSKSQPPSQIANENDMNNSSSPSSPLVLKIKRQTTKQHSHELHSPSSHMSEEEQHQHSPSTHNLQRLKRSSLPQTTATRRPSSPAFNGKQQQATKRAVTIDNNNNDLTSHIDDISATKRFKRDDSNCSSSNKVDACVETVSVGLATEPDHLGPCEPGTSVVLEGIVWNETDSGVLVVNVTWRGKTYVGTLLDSTKQDWACPRLTCESPTSDYDPRSTSKTSRSKRNGAGGTARCAAQQAVSLCQQITSSAVTVGVDDRKLRNNIKSRQSKRLSNLSATITEEVTSQPSPLTSPYRTNNQAFFPPDSAATTPAANAESQLISCSEPQCHKRFASTIALNYHLSNAHKKTEPSAIIPQANTRDEEDVAHILANVADYVRRTSPPSSMRCSPEHHRQAVPSPAIVHSPPSTVKAMDNGSPAPLAWPCPQISSKLVLPSPIANSERAPSPNSTRCTANNTDASLLESKPVGEPTEAKSSIRPADHYLLHVQDQVAASTNPSSPSSADSSTNKDATSQKKRQQTPTPPPPPPPPPALTASSPAYSDISDEEPTTDEQTLPPSTVNLLTGTNGKIDENGNNLHPSSSSSFLTSADLTNPAWTAQMIFQQFGPLMQQQALATAAISSNKDLSTTPNRLNSNNTCPASNGTSDSTVKNILDARRSSTSKISSTSSSPPLPPPSGLYHYPTSNESKFPTPIINTLTSPNENLLHLSSSSSTATSPSTASTAIKPMDILDYSLNNSRASNNGGQYHHSSSLHPSR